MRHLLEEATVLDPRFKLKAPSPAWDRITDKITDMLSKVVTVKSEPDASGPDSEDETPPTKTPKLSALEELFGDDTDDVQITHVEKKTPSEKAKDEVEMYKFIPPIPHSSDPLEFWKARQYQLPNLATLVIEYLCVPATSTPLDRVFSMAGDTISNERAKLSPDRADMLIFLKKNTQI